MHDNKLEVYMQAVTDTFVRARSQIREALRMIAERGSDRAPAIALQLLALRRYLDHGDAEMEKNWSWTATEVVRFENEEPAKTLYAEAKKVQAAFAKDNPGYTLALSPIRSLEKQVKLWNENTSIHQAGMNLVTRMQKELEKDKYSAVPEPVGVAAFRDVLKKAFISPEPTNAVPGTSDHGRATAVDFVVMRAGVPIASTKVAEIPTRWQHDGWETKLIKACKGTRLQGPLKKPYEPWHWVLAQ